MVEAVIIQASQDKSWRVKLSLSKNFAEIADLCGKEIAENPLSNIFTTVLKDPETEVRIAACDSLKRFLRCLSAERLNNMIPYIQKQLKNHSQKLKKNSQFQIVKFPKIIPKKF